MTVGWNAVAPERRARDLTAGLEICQGRIITAGPVLAMVSRLCHRHDFILGLRGTRHWRRDQAGGGECESSGEYDEPHGEPRWQWCFILTRKTAHWSGFVPQILTIAIAQK
jgi:hypothetical protein